MVQPVIPLQYLQLRADLKEVMVVEQDQETTHHQVVVVEVELVHLLLEQADPEVLVVSVYLYQFQVQLYLTLVVAVEQLIIQEPREEDLLAELVDLPYQELEVLQRHRVLMMELQTEVVEVDLMVKVHLQQALVDQELFI
jgi:hypothetical protein